MLKIIRYLAESILAKSAYWVFRLLPFNVASSMGGVISRTLGPFSSRDKLARKNLQRAIPDLDEKQVDEIITGMWDNLGRTVAEFPRMNDMNKYAFAKIVEVEGVEHIEQAKQSAKGSLFIGKYVRNKICIAFQYRHIFSVTTVGIPTGGTKISAEILILSAG